MPVRIGEEVQALSRQAGLNSRPGSDLDPLLCPILVLGAPRSGTTWLAKIVDSHPDVLYRHEPDTYLAGPSSLTAESLPGLLASWVTDQSLRSSGKQPLFAKSWQPSWARGLRRLLVTGGVAAARSFKGLSRLRIPECGSWPAPRVAIKSIAWAAGAPVLARSLPDSRTIFILRHPCGQVASVMRGNRQRRFDLLTAGTDMPFDEMAAERFAGQHGVGPAGFQTLSAAGKYAWSWRAFNEPAHLALSAMPNVLVLIYEALCADPEAEARRVLAFAALPWSGQTRNFVLQSSAATQGRRGYYSIFRDAAAAAESWRWAMPVADQEAVRAVLTGSPLTQFWPDLRESR